MKQLVYKDVLKDNPRKREVSIEEINDRLNPRVSKKWMCKYFVREKYCSESKEDRKLWIQLKKERGIVRNCHILRQINTETGENKVICKILGDLYLVAGTVVYRIIYVHEIKIHISAEDKHLKVNNEPEVT